MTDLQKQKSSEQVASPAAVGPRNANCQFAIALMKFIERKLTVRVTT
jgi:hypothetical protein